MSFEAVTAQYINAISKQIKRRNRQERDFFTKAEEAAIEFYGKAAQQLKGLDAENTDMWGPSMEKPAANSGHPERRTPEGNR